jgi:hypothetical protein
MAAALLLGSSAPGQAKVFYARAEALALAFPTADHVETKSVFLTEKQVTEVTQRAKAPVESQLVTFHVGQQDNDILGYAFIETHIVRTRPETFLVVLSPQGSIQKLLVLAFYEPQEYLPSDRWLAQFHQQALGPQLQLYQDIHGIAGSTLTARAVTRAVRKVLALFHIVIQGSK